MLKAVFFDFDNTLQDLDRAFETATRTILGPLCGDGGLEVDAVMAQMEAVWPALWRDFLAGTLPESKLYVRWFTQAFERMDISLVDAQASLIASDYERLFEWHLGLYPEALSAIQVLLAERPDLSLAILTNGPKDRQKRRIAARGLSEFFLVQVISGEVGFSKPDEAFFRAALEVAGVEPTEAVMIGDDPRTDISGARAVGIPAIWLNRQGSDWPAELPMLPSAQARDLKEAVTLALRME